MTLIYPIASDARGALDASRFARTREEARAATGEDMKLVSEWLRPDATEREAVWTKAQTGLARGYVQFYEGASGEPVIALTFWREHQKAAALPIEALQVPASVPEDHTDDLYFAKPSVKSRRPRRPADVNQMDLFDSSSRDRGASED
ncbi:MAG: hypothetical protein KGS00_01400 [Alphaproteobacteria bacterium]|nr:hypothetical protein [Alphaproteobacteria bacterium]